MNYNKHSKIIDGRVYNLYYTRDDVPKYEKEMVEYAQMAKRFMNKPFNTPLAIVGNYDWHEKFPYEKYLFYDQMTNNLLVPADSKISDFGCGPGRMVNRAKKIFNTVDGIDISEYAIDYARTHFPGSTFYISSGIDVGESPDDHYDLIFSTIAIQHIPCKSIRKNIFRGIYNSLKPGGYMSIQIAYHPTMTAGVWSADTEHASYDSDFWNAKATNGHADMIINKNDITTLEADLFEIFNSVPNFYFENVSNKYANLNGSYHAPYWAEDWLFIQVRKA